jgi:beta-galactosidase
MPAYKLKYGIDNLDQETGPSREDFLDIGKLELDQTYLVQLVAINPAGETPSNPILVKVEQRDFLPPGVRYVEPTNDGFFVAYTTDETDFIYRIRYREKDGPSGNDEIISSRTPGLMAVRRLKNGRPYTFEVQRVTDNNSYSRWSKTYEVVPDGGQLPAVPWLKSVLRNKSEAVLSFVPVPKAIGYEIQYRESGRGEAGWHSFFLNRSEVDYGRIGDLQVNQTYEFRIAAMNANGKSAYSPIIKR